MNVWNFTGNLGRDAEMRYTSKGEPALSFSVAVKAGYGQHEKSSWARCTLWGKRGESVAPYLVKGALVGVSGELAQTKFTTKDGVDQYNLDVRVNDVTLLGKKSAEPAKAAAGIPVQDDYPQDDISW